MKVLRIVGKTCFILFLIALFLLPVVALYAISQEEQAQYTVAAVNVGPERGYGESCAVCRLDMPESTTVQAKVVSSKQLYQELSAYRYPYQIRWTVSTGDAVKAGDCLGTYNGSAIAAQFTGVLREINLGEKPYVCFDSLEDLVLECTVSAQQEAIFARKNLELTDETGTALRFVDMSLIRGDEGRTVRLEYDKENLVYGTRYTDLLLYTGRVYSQTLAVDVDCVYQKAGSDSHFVRVLDDEGYFVWECPVEVGYSNGEMICVTGVDEGVWCDSGYKSLIEVKDNAGA